MSRELRFRAQEKSPSLQARQPDNPHLSTKVKLWPNEESCQKVPPLKLPKSSRSRRNKKSVDSIIFIVSLNFRAVMEEVTELTATPLTSNIKRKDLVRSNNERRSKSRPPTSRIRSRSSSPRKLNTKSDLLLFGDGLFNPRSRSGVVKRVPTALEKERQERIDQENRFEIGT